MKKNNKYIFFLFSFLLFPSSSFSATNNFNHTKRPYSLTISGGISLGVYEAGLNWVIIEQLRNGRLSGDEMTRLLSVTGASAGAINTLIASLRYCEVKKAPSTVEGNLFNKTWRTIGIEGLMPDDNTEYEKLEGYPDGILSRKIFSNVLSLLEEKSNARIYRDNCYLNIGLTVTRHVPEDKVIGLGDEQQRIKVQRFVIPLTLRTQNGYAVFRNNLNYYKRNKELGYLLLRQDSEGIVPFKHIIRSALASSAFPYAFGRVRLPYCKPEVLNGEKDLSGEAGAKSVISDDAVLCPKGYEEAIYDFVDGGFFDNVPLGLAVELSECRSNMHEDCIREAVSEKEVLKNEVVNYIYMEPSKRRKNIDTKPDKEDELSDGYGIYNQGKFWLEAQEIHANAELYSALREKFDVRNEKNRVRRLLLTDRYPPLGGAYLAHFGAFFAQIFRDFDYYAGVYDGMVNFSNLCLREGSKYLNTYGNGNNVKSQCINLGTRELADKTNPHSQHGRRVGQIMHELVNNLLQDGDLNARKMIRLLAEDEFKTYLSADKRFVEWKWLDDLPDYRAKTADGKPDFLYSFFSLLKKDRQQDFSTLIAGLTRLKKIYPEHFKSDPVNGSNRRLNKMLSEPDTWQFALGRKLLARLYQLEKSDKDNHFGIIPIRLGEMALNSFDINEDNKLWAISSTQPHGWQHLIPDEVAVDGSQTGLVFTYRNALYRFDDSRTYIEGEFSPLHWLRKRTDRSHFASVGLNLRHANKSAAFSSYGMGLRAYKNYESKPNVDNNVIYGYAIDLGLLADKYRITLEFKDIHEGYNDEAWLLKFGLGDFKGVSNFLFGD